MHDASIWAALLVGAAATYIWRAAGVVLAGRLDPGSPIFGWVACVAYALLAGLVARMILLPVGPLAGTPLEYRLLSATVALGAFFFMGRSILWGCSAGIVSLMVATSLRP